MRIYEENLRMLKRIKGTKSTFSNNSQGSKRSPTNSAMKKNNEVLKIEGIGAGKTHLSLDSEVMLSSRSKD